MTLPVSSGSTDAFDINDGKPVRRPGSYLFLSLSTHSSQACSLSQTFMATQANSVPHPTLIQVRTVLSCLGALLNTYRSIPSCESLCGSSCLLI